MSAFLTLLDGKKVDPDNWQLNAPLVYQSDYTGGLITVPAGFITNLYTGIGDGVGDRAAVVHDYLYGGKEFERIRCDKIFLEAMKADGVPSWRAWLRYVGVRMFGGKYYGD